MQKVKPFLWFASQAEEAMNFYTTVFKDAKPGNVMRYGEAGPLPEGTVLSASFEIAGMEFIALNGGEPIPFTSAISFLIGCETQEEVDHLWFALSEGGETQRCGWLKDKFGVTWQVVPSVLGDMLGDDDEEKSARVMRAMLEMDRLDIARLQEAYDGAQPTAST